MKTTLIEFSQKESKKFNALGLRATYGITISKLKKTNDSISIFTADTSTSAGLDRFKNSYPDSFFDCGIAEQCMISTAAGYVEEGGTALASTFAPFLVLRSAEQLKLTLGYMNLPLIVTGLASGVSLGFLGYTHCCIEDLALILNIPNIFTYVPSDCFELNRVLPHLINLKKPTYIRLTGLAKNKPVHEKDFNIDFFSPLEIFSGGKELLIISSGAISSNVKSVIEQIDEKTKNKLSFMVLPFVDHENTTEILSKKLPNYLNVLVLDEGTYGGIASFISRVILENNIPTKFHFRVHPNSFLKCGDYQYMLRQCGLDIVGIESTIKNILN